MSLKAQKAVEVYEKWQCRADTQVLGNTVWDGKATIDSVGGVILCKQWPLAVDLEKHMVWREERKGSLS